MINTEILREYDIRGIYQKSLKLEDVENIAKKISNIISKINTPKIIIGHDGRLSSLEIKNKRLSQDLIFNDGLAFSGAQFIRVLPTSKDKTSEQLIEVDSKSISLTPNGYKASFNITNQSVVDRVSGHFFSILKSRNTFQFFPKKISSFKSISF